jgi:hypothetical protein
MLAHTHDHAVSLHIGSYPPIYSLYGALWSSYKRARFLHVSKVLSDTPVTYSSTLHYTHNPVIELTAVHLCAGKPGVAQQCLNLFHQCFKYTAPHTQPCNQAHGCASLPWKAWCRTRAASTTVFQSISSVLHHTMCFLHPAAQRRLHLFSFSVPFAHYPLLRFCYGQRLELVHRDVEGKCVWPT